MIGFTASDRRGLQIVTARLWVAAIGAVLIALYVMLPGFGLRGQGELLLRRPLSEVSSNQRLRAVQEREFFSERNLITIRVPRDMDLDKLIRMYQIERSRADLERILGQRRQLRKNERLGPVHLTPPSAF